MSQKKGSLYTSQHNARHEIRDFLKNAAEAQQTYVSTAHKVDTTAFLQESLLTIQYTMSRFSDLTQGLFDELSPFLPEITTQYDALLKRIDQEINKHNAAVQALSTTAPDLPELNTALLNLHMVQNLQQIITREKDSLSRSADYYADSSLPSSIKMNTFNPTPHANTAPTLSPEVQSYIKACQKHVKDYAGYATTYLDSTLKALKAIEKTLSEDLVKVIQDVPSSQRTKTGPTITAAIQQIEQHYPQQTSWGAPVNSLSSAVFQEKLKEDLKISVTAPSSTKKQ